MTALAKRDVERLLAEFDNDAVGALRDALAIVLDLPGASFESLLDASSLEPSRRERLRARDAAALDELAAELNERRTID